MEYPDNDLLEKVKIINNSFQSPSFGPINMLVSSMVTRDILFYLAGKLSEVHSIGKRIGIHTNNLKIEYQKHKKLKNCNCL